MLLVGIIISYLVGSVPFAYLFGKIIKGIDIRDFGSGNVGATNAFRLLGPGWGITVLILDILKGIISVTGLADYFIGHTEVSAEILRIVFGFASVCGHNWTLFLRFKGGKGVATSLGVLIGLSTAIPGLRLILLLVTLVWLAVFLSFRFVSLASVASALSFPAFVFMFHRSKELLALGIALAALIVLRHKKNLVGLISGKERPLRFRKP